MKKYLVLTMSKSTGVYDDTYIYATSPKDNAISEYLDSITKSSGNILWAIFPDNVSYDTALSYFKKYTAHRIAG